MATQGPPSRCGTWSCFDRYHGCGGGWRDPGGQRRCNYGDDKGRAGGVKCDKLLISARRTPNVEGLGLETIGVAFGKTPGAGIAVNQALQTSLPHIYAAGDCCGSKQFTHYAGWQAFNAVRNALLPRTANGHSDLVPRCTFTDPEVAHAGMRLEEAAARYGGDSRVVESSTRGPW